MRHHKFWRLVSILAAAVAAGCATVTVRKVPTPTQYTHWTDDMQAQADSILGIRFYLPRPFVSVFESFPIRTDIYWANGYVSQDGKYVYLTSISGTDSFAKSLNVAIPTTSVSFPKTPAVNAQGQPGGAGSNPSLTVPVTANPPAAPPTPVSPLPADSPAPKTGQNQKASTNNNSVFAYQPLRGNFDLVYMPDFEEQYAVDSYAGLGNANFQVNLGQGWSLQGFNSLEDNSEINKRIFDVIDFSIQTAKTAASAELGQLLPAVQSAAKAAQAGQTLLAQGAPGAPATAQGTQVTLKIVVLHYAAKGLYPVIKPRELQERVAESQTVYGVLDLFKLFPRLEWSSNFDKNSLARAQQAIQPQEAHFTTPRYPYEYISFNTFQYVSLEVVSPSEQPFKTKYPGTGTDNEAGSARTSEIIGLIKDLQGILPTANPIDKPVPAPQVPASQVPAPQVPASQLTTDQKTQMSTAILKIRLPDTGSNYYSLAAPDYGKFPTVSAALKINGGHPDTTEADALPALQKAVIDAAAQQSIQVTSLAFSNKPDLTKLQAFYGDLKDPTKVGYPKFDPSVKPIPDMLVIDDAWLETETTKNVTTGTLTVKLKLQGTTKPTPSDSDLQQAILGEAQPLLDKQFSPSIKITKFVNATGK